jgi:ATP-dependent Lon protease
MPVTLSTIPKRATTTKNTKKQDDAAHNYKSNLNGPGPNQPPPESDVTDDNDESMESCATSGTAAAGTTPGTPTTTTPTTTPTTTTTTTTTTTKKKAKNDNLAERLEMNQLLSQLYPSKHMTKKLAALQALATTDLAPPAKKTRARKVTNQEATATTAVVEAAATSATHATTEDPVANAIITSAFASSDNNMIVDSFKTPLSSPLSKPPNAPKRHAYAPKKSAAKPKQSKYNIIIQVEPRSEVDDCGDISKRLDFGNPSNASNASKTDSKTDVASSKTAVASSKTAVASSKTDAASSKTAVASSKTDVAASKSAKQKAPPAIVTNEYDDDDDSDEDYVPGCSDSESSWSTYDDEDEDDDSYYDDDEYYEDDDSYSSSSDSSDDNIEELEELQQKHIVEMNMLQSLRATYEELLAKDKSNRIVAKQLKTLKESEEKIKQELDELMHRQKRKNSKKFRKLLRRKSSTNDLDYFKKHLTLPEQRAMIAEMDAVAKVSEIEKPYKLTLLESDIPRDMKAVALRKVGMLQYMEPGCGEYCKLKTWVDAFMRIPFNRHKNLPITLADGVDRCHEFMTSAKIRLDAAVYGLNDAKMQIMQMVGQWIANPAAIGTAVAIHGPPGTGKTSLVKEGISKILGRDFEFIALGGATDSSFLEGHSYTYEGSMWGKIVDILMRCKSSNPVIYFDELDKISETSKGDEIVGILTHLTDTSQNAHFHDKYFSEVTFDLSKCLFIFSYNDESRVNPVLLDRMYKIRTTGYSTKDKTFIAQNYLIPRIRAEVAFAEGDIIIPDTVVEYIVENHTQKESGVRNLKRCLETIYTKLNLHRLMRPGTQLFDEKEKSFELTFPYTVNRDVVDKLIKKNDSDRPNISLYL